MTEEMIIQQAQYIVSIASFQSISHTLEARRKLESDKATSNDLASEGP